MPYIVALSNALLKVCRTQSGHTSARPLFFSLFPLRVHGGKQEVTKPLLFLSSGAAEEVKSGRNIMDALGGSFLWTCGAPTIPRHSRLIPLGVCSLCQLDADGILWVPYSLPSQHRWQQEYLEGIEANFSYFKRQLLIRQCGTVSHLGTGAEEFNQSEMFIPFQTTFISNRFFFSTFV